MQYVIHILQIKLWEWRGIKENWDMLMQKNGPFKEAVEGTDIAKERICELTIAIKQLNKQP